MSASSAFGGRALYHHILNHRELYGLPRKFNISFDGGGCIAMLEDTADIGFAAVRVGREKPIAEGVYFRMRRGRAPRSRVGSRRGPGFE